MTRMSAINPENGTVSYTYNPTTNTLASKTDAKSQKLTYQYDGYNRLTSVTWSNAPGGSKVLRSYMYDSNTLDTSFSGSYTQGRLVAVQNAQFTPGNGALVSWTQLVEMYGYVQAGGVSGKRLQVNEHVPYPLGGGQTLTRNLDAAYTYNSEGQVASVKIHLHARIRRHGAIKRNDGPKPQHGRQQRHLRRRQPAALVELSNRRRDSTI